MHTWILLAGGGLFLYVGAEWLVGGASALALRLRIPQLVVGLTVVAFGTSAPEVVVGLQAARDGHGDVALGNVLGSNVANLGLILATAVLIRPTRVDAALRSRELPMLAGTTLVLPLLLWNGAIDGLEGAALVTTALAYTALMVRATLSYPALAEADVAAAAIVEVAAESAGAPHGKGTWRSGTTALAGLGLLIFGADTFVDGAVRLSAALGLSERVIGLTVVAIGTSLPEWVTSTLAARRGHSDLAIGNALGSNIFNSTLCLGTAALAGPVGAPLLVVASDLAAMGLLTALVSAYIARGSLITRGQGALLLALFAAYLGHTLWRG